MVHNYKEDVDDITDDEHRQILTTTNTLPKVTPGLFLMANLTP